MCEPSWLLSAASGCCDRSTALEAEDEMALDRCFHSLRLFHKWRNQNQPQHLYRRSTTTIHPSRSRLSGGLQDAQRNECFGFPSTCLQTWNACRHCCACVRNQGINCRFQIWNKCARCNDTAARHCSRKRCGRTRRGCGESWANRANVPSGRIHECLGSWWDTH